MRLLKLTLDGITLFENNMLSLDFFASDRVTEPRGTTLLDAPIYSQNILAIAGINATGKTTALKIVLSFLNVLAGRPLNDDFREVAFSFAEESVKAEAIFFHAGSFYGLSSHLSTTPTAQAKQEELWTFTEETLWATKRLPSKKTLATFDAFTHHAHVIQTRASLSSESRDYLPSDTSIVTALTRTSTQAMPKALFNDCQWLRLTERAAVKSYLQAFDESIESCQFDRRSNNYSLSFKSGCTIQVSGGGERLGEFLSDGTVKGANIVEQALAALQTGGYLVVDEIENHLNKQLVGLIIDLFESDDTNSLGATLIFSTHYPEILDFIRRKDDVYFFSRDADHQVKTTLYSSKVKRIENKKSEVFLSNYLRGTAPKYAAARQLKEHVRLLVAEADHE